MMTYRWMLLYLGIFSGSGLCAINDENFTKNKMLDNYKIYSLARCITNNYESMGVNFDSLHFKDYTMGFIDIEEEFAFSARRNNVLDDFIKNKTDHFYKPKQTEGDLIVMNLVIYDCVAFSQSKEVDSFLNNLILKEGSGN